MIKYPFVKRRTDINAALLNLEVLDKYFFSAMNAGEIKPSTQYRVQAAINNIVADLRCLSMKRSTKLLLTIPNLKGITEVAQPLKLDLKKIPVKEKLVPYTTILSNSLKSVMGRKNQEILQQDVDAMIVEFKKLEKAV